MSHSSPACTRARATTRPMRRTARRARTPGSPPFFTTPTRCATGTTTSGRRGRTCIFLARYPLRVTRPPSATSRPQPVWSAASRPTTSISPPTVARSSALPTSAARSPPSAAPVSNPSTSRLEAPSHSPTATTCRSRAPDSRPTARPSCAFARWTARTTTPETSDCGSSTWPPELATRWPPNSIGGPMRWRGQPTAPQCSSPPTMMVTVRCSASTSLPEQPRGSQRVERSPTCRCPPTARPSMPCALAGIIRPAPSGSIRTRSSRNRSYFQAPASSTNSLAVWNGLRRPHRTACGSRRGWYFPLALPASAPHHSCCGRTAGR